MMCNPQDSSGKFLWWYLQSLEFHQDVATSIGNKTNIKHLNLGMNMFDKPNKEAFYLVIHFLFKKLNPSRVEEVFRHCWPVLDRKADTEFRKGAFGWLQEIANEEGSSFPKVLASHLLSPSGPRFVNLMLHLAKHVMLKTMKTFTTDHAWVPEAAAVPASSQELEMKRFLMLKRQFQRVTVGQDCLIQDYQKRARRLEKSLKDHKTEDVKYDDLIKKYENHVNLEKDLLEKIPKVRSLWAEIDKSLAGLEEERCVLASVIDGRVDQYVLDGKEINVKIPAVLLDRMESLSLQTTAGSLYEGDQSIILRLLELLNVALGLLSEERAKLSVPASKLSHQTLQEQSLLMTRSKETLKNIRRKMAKEDLPQTKLSIKKLEVDWERKWAECLKQTSLIAFLNEDPVLNFLSPMAPLSFEPATDANFQASIFSQYPAKLPESTHQASNEGSSLTEEFKTALSSIFAEDKMEDLNFSNCLASPRPASPYLVHSKSPAALPDVPLVTPTHSPFQVSQRIHFPSQVKSSALKPKAQILELEYENLASQFAEAVTMSPGNGRSSSMELEQLLNTLSDPFTTKKQIPRTPESLIMDVRTSWRKAVEEGKSDRKHGKGHEGSYYLVTPVAKVQERTPSPDLFSSSASVITKAEPLPCSPLPPQQGNSLHSTLSWDSTQLEDLSQNSSNFSIAHETFPDEETDGSMNCSGGSEETHEAEEIFLPPVISRVPETETALEMARRHLNDSFTGRIQETKADYLPAALHTSPGMGSCKEKVFSLDLEHLESFTSPLRGDLTLPNLVTFSPMDEL